MRPHPLPRNTYGSWDYKGGGGGGDRACNCTSWMWSGRNDRFVPKYTFHSLTVRWSSGWLANCTCQSQADHTHSSCWRFGTNAADRLHSKFRHTLTIPSGTYAPLVTHSSSFCTLAWIHTVNLVGFPGATFINSTRYMHISVSVVQSKWFQSKRRRRKEVIAHAHFIEYFHTIDPYVTIHAKTNQSRPKIFLVRVWFRIYSISSTYIVILEPIALTTLEIWQGECAPVSGSKFSKTQCLGPPNFPYTLSPARSKRCRFMGWDYWQKEWSKEVSKEQYLSYRSSSFVVYVCSNRPVSFEAYCVSTRVRTYGRLLPAATAKVSAAHGG